jgi:hypothetical protein
LRCRSKNSGDQVEGQERAKAVSCVLPRGSWDASWGATPIRVARPALAAPSARPKWAPRTEQRFGTKPQRLAADTAYGSAATLDWIVNEKQIAPHIPVWDRSKREDGTFSRGDFTYDKTRDVYICPAFNTLNTTGKIMNGDMLAYRASVPNCATCAFKARFCPKEPARKILRSVYEEARDVARALAKTEAFEQSCRDRKRVEILFAHLKRILRLGRLRLRGPRGAQFEFTIAATAQNLRRLAKLMARPPPAVAACVT